MSRLHPRLDTFGSSLNGPLDEATLSLVSQNFRQSFHIVKNQDNEIENDILNDILQVRGLIKNENGSIDFSINQKTSVQELGKVSVFSCQESEVPDGESKPGLQNTSLAC